MANKTLPWGTLHLTVSDDEKVQSVSMTFTTDGSQKRLIPLIFHSFHIILKYITQKWKNISYYYPTAPRSVQITHKTSTNITRYLHSRRPIRQVFSQRAGDELDWSYLKMADNRNNVSDDEESEWLANIDPSLLDKSNEEKQLEDSEIFNHLLKKIETEDENWPSIFGLAQWCNSINERRPMEDRYVQDWTLMRFKLLIVSITNSPHW